MALRAQDLTTPTVDSRAVGLVISDPVRTEGAPGAPVLSSRVPAPGSTVSPPVATVSFVVQVP